jgi:hypothetical protein
VHGSSIRDTNVCSPRAPCIGSTKRSCQWDIHCGMPWKSMWCAIVEPRQQPVGWREDDSADHEERNQRGEKARALQNNSVHLDPFSLGAPPSGSNKCLERE